MKTANGSYLVTSDGKRIVRAYSIPAGPTRQEIRWSGKMSSKVKRTFKVKSVKTSVRVKFSKPKFGKRI